MLRIVFIPLRLQAMKKEGPCCSVGLGSNVFGQILAGSVKVPVGGSKSLDFPIGPSTQNGIQEIFLGIQSIRGQINHGNFGTMWRHG